MLQCCIEGERVGDDGGEVVGVDCGDDDGSGGVPAPPEERGRGPPFFFFFFFFFLDLLLRWEKGFPSGPWLTWLGRGESPSEIGSISLFLRSHILPLHRFFYIRRSVTPIGVNLSPRFFS